MNTEPTSRFEEVTVELARHYLETALPGNRPIMPSVVATYQRDMATGRWNWLNVEGLVFDSEGHLQEGRHRLTAIIANGVTVRMWVTRGADPSIFTVLNTGKSRSSSHRLGFAGFKNTNHLAAVARFAVLWEAGKPWTHGLVPSREEVVAATEKYPALVEAAERTASWPARRTLSPSQAGSAWWILGQIDADEANAFMSALKDGAGLEAGNPVLVLRERLMADRERGGRYTAAARRSESRLLLTFMAWSHYLARNQITKLQLPPNVSDDTFYTVLGLR